MRPFQSFLGGLAVALLTALSTVRAAEVLEQVPRDALGFVVVRNLAETDAKAGRVLSEFGSRFPGPLALLKSIGGIQAGLDEQRDLMVALLPPQNNSARFNLALWLPVKDYDDLVHSLDGDPGRRVAAVTLAGEDLLVVRQDDWAVVMDPDQRDRLELLRETKPTPAPQVAEWTEWLATNDAAVVVLPSGMKALWSLAASEDLFEPLPPTPPHAPADDLFGPANQGRVVAGGWPAARDWIRSTFGERHELARWAAEAEGAACGLRLDAKGNARAGVRLAFSPEAIQSLGQSQPATTAARALPALYAGGEFVASGSGNLSPQWTVPAVAPYVRQVANDLTTNLGVTVEESAVARFRQAVEEAIAKVNAYSVLTRPGTGTDAVFSNNFLAVRVDSSPEFLQLFDETVRLWNEMLDTPRAALRLVFKTTQIKIAEREGREYSIDMGAAFNIPAIPGAGTSNEQLFGPDGLFRLQVVEIDDQTVLLAVATEAQVTQVIEGLAVSANPAKEPSELNPAASLLSQRSCWRLFLSPHGYTQWLKRQMDAVLGAVIGGPIVPQFPTSPPVGFAGGVQGNVVWVEAAAPIETIHALGQFWRQ